MKKQLTRQDKLKKELAKINQNLWELEKEKEQKKNELEKYVKKHRSLKFDGLETSDTQKLLAIYDLLDKKYPIDWQGGLRCDNRGMALHFWLDDDPDFLIIHLSSTSKNICFSGSTNWILKAPTLAEKIESLRSIKAEVKKILEK